VARAQQPMIRIRASRADDVPRLFEVWQAAVAATHGFVSAEDKAEIAGIVREQYLPNVPLWVAVDEADRPLGFMGMTGAMMDALFIDPTHHGRGLGRAMVEHARLIAPDLSVDVNEQNEAAVAFYRHLGFRQVGCSPVDDSGRPYPLLRLRLDSEYSSLRAERSNPEGR
jgi:putative acetyltransferase